MRRELDDLLTMKPVALTNNTSPYSLIIFKWQHKFQRHDLSFHIDVHILTLFIMNVTQKQKQTFDLYQCRFSWS